MEYDNCDSDWHDYRANMQYVYTSSEVENAHFELAYYGSSHCELYQSPRRQAIVEFMGDNDSEE